MSQSVAEGPQVLLCVGSNDPLDMAPAVPMYRDPARSVLCESEVLGRRHGDDKVHPFVRDVDDSEVAIRWDKELVGEVMRELGDSREVVDTAGSLWVANYCRGPGQSIDMHKASFTYVWAGDSLRR